MAGKSTSAKQTSGGTPSTAKTTTDGADIQPVRKAAGKVEAFARLSEALASGESMVPPTLLTGQARREHVRATLREDHATRIEERASGTEVKFETLADDLFKFYRGTALLFYRDMVGTDGHMPTVMCLGDVHPENFGVMPDRNGAPIFGVNDFDEAIYAPFTWDLKRGATGFWIAAKTEGGLKRKKRVKVVRHFVKGYLDAMQRYAERATEKNESYRTHNSPKVIRRLFEEAWEERHEWLREDYLDPTGRGFKPTDELQPISSSIETFQKAIDDLAKAKGFEAPKRSGELKVKDVCIRHGQGTASLGLPRYYVLIEGPSKDATDDIIIEFKRARRSALSGLTPPTQFDAGDNADRIVHGQRVQLAHGDIFYGAVEIDGESFMSRERAPFRDDIDLDELSDDTWKDYAAVCGAALAQSHALSDDLGQIDYDVEPSIMEAATPRKLFLADICRFAEEAADRLKNDHKLFCEDFEDGAFDQVEMIYR
ncbi:MAG: DUF2252 domain-containing protein [Rhodobacteraceae bacterium]|jgi:uncharacterized protein (DUF2252 family)|uniref:DUF2252 domain-containing protein n=1 Tax=Salipiger profundus TaxID=1229727 RepID=A0A1U7D180_9RHOB|nr:MULTISPECIES: DUF2252 family protein [Salipiger]APX21836.1 hypothetical protein Ga0080559_TMP1040 [Salipiger profundus]MAB08020.1 DUF2252 domain-containing protein [Paracoccaceae bacterium]GGA05672.1 hypothetical protein GCM10011326_16620 [Salipiger profundus]SFC34040.1 Uncharacterized conserved protein, DUF2252 family [Salipiger profundus]